VCFNGHILQRHLANAYMYNPAAYCQMTYLNVMANRQRKPAGAMRQWRAVPVPVSWVNLEGENRISLIALRRPVTIYGAYPLFYQNKISLPSLSLSGFGQLFLNTDKLEPRIIDASIKISPGKSYYRYDGHSNTRDLSPSLGRQLGDYRLHLVLGLPQARTYNQPLSQPLDISINPSAFGQSSRTVIQSNLAGKIPLPEFRSGSHLHFSFEANALPIGKSKASLTTLLYVSGSDPQNASNMASPLLFLPDTPATSPVVASGTLIKLSGDFPLTALPKGLKTLTISLSSDKPCSVNNMHISLAPEYLPTFTAHQLLYF